MRTRCCWIKFRCALFERSFIAVLWQWACLKIAANAEVLHAQEPWIERSACSNRCLAQRLHFNSSFALSRAFHYPRIQRSACTNRCQAEASRGCISVSGCALSRSTKSRVLCVQSEYFLCSPQITTDAIIKHSHQMRSCDHRRSPCQRLQLLEACYLSENCCAFHCRQQRVLWRRRGHR